MPEHFLKSLIEKLSEQFQITSRSTFRYLFINAESFNPNVNFNPPNSDGDWRARQSQAGNTLPRVRAADNAIGSWRRGPSEASAGSSHTPVGGADAVGSWRRGDSKGKQTSTPPVQPQANAKNVGSKNNFDSLVVEDPTSRPTSPSEGSSKPPPPSELPPSSPSEHPTSRPASPSEGSSKPPPELPPSSPSNSVSQDQDASLRPSSPTQNPKQSVEERGKGGGGKKKKKRKK